MCVFVDDVHLLFCRDAPGVRFFFLIERSWSSSFPCCSFSNQVSLRVGWWCMHGDCCCGCWPVCMCSCVVLPFASSSTISLTTTFQPLALGISPSHWKLVCDTFIQRSERDFFLHSRRNKCTPSALSLSTKVQLTITIFCYATKRN